MSLCSVPLHVKAIGTKESLIRSPGIMTNMCCYMSLATEKFVH